jgi:hypothetical protein
MEADEINGGVLPVTNDRAKSRGPGLFEGAERSADGGMTKEEIFRQALDLFDRFENEIWKKEEIRESFHNRYHTEAFMAAGRMYLEKVSSGLDPLDFFADLDRYNEGKSADERYTFEEFLEAFEWSGLGHDMGNILKKITVSEGHLFSDFHDKYLAEGAEERSKEIAEVLMGASDMETAKKDKLIPLVRHLIDQTKFVPSDSSIPFQKFAQAVDKYGGNLFSENPDRQEGLLAEILGENPGKVIRRPDDFINFTRNSLLTMAEEDRKKLLEMWGKDLPDEISGLPSTPMPVTVLLEKIKSGEIPVVK